MLMTNSMKKAFIFVSLLPFYELDLVITSQQFIMTL